MSQLTFGDSFGPESAVPVENLEKDKKSSWYKGRALSHSSMSTYQLCPQKWKFRYVDKIRELPKPYFSFGRSVHTGLEFLFEKIGEDVPGLDDLLTHYKSRWVSEGYETAPQEKWFFQEGIRILKGFYAKHAKDIKKVFKVEYRFNFDIEGVPLTGFIDRIDETPSGKLAIVDYKTGKSFDKSRVRKDPQLTLYQMACKELLGKEIESLTLYHLNSLTPLSVPPHGENLQSKIKETVVQTAKGITDKKFDPKPDAAGHCQYCDYVQICPAFAGKKLPGSGANDEKELAESVDRLGKIQTHLKELESERLMLMSDLKVRMVQLKKEQLEGKYYRAKLSVNKSSEGDDLILERLTDAEN